MAEPDDLFVAQNALQRGLVNRDQLRECLFKMMLDRRAGNARPLGIMLVAHGLVPEAQLVEILSARIVPPGGEAPARDVELGKLLVLAGAATTAQVNECLSLQRAEPSKRLGELLVEKGYATPEQVKRALAYHRKAVFVCGSCKTRFNVTNAKLDAQYSCKKCGGKLAPASVDNLRADSSHELPAIGVQVLHAGKDAPSPQRPLEHQVQIDRALAAYLKQKALAPPEAVREAEQMQMDFLRFGMSVPLEAVLRRLGVVPKADSAELEKAVASPAWARQIVPGYAVTTMLANGPFTSLMTAEPVFGQGAVALKLLHASLANDPAAIERFRAEAALFMRVDHAAILKGHEFGTGRAESGAGVPYLIMEYSRAETLAQWIATRGRLSPAAVIRASLELADALRHLHAEGLVHRDLRPEAVLLDARTHPRICDLAFAGKAEGDGPRRDVWCFGRLMHTMLSGQTVDAPPEKPLAELFDEGAVPDLGALHGPPALRAVVSRFFDPVAAQRLATADAAAAALKELST